MINFIDLAAQQRLIQSRLLGRVKTVFGHGRYVLGPEVSELEEALAKFAQVDHCVGTSSGTMALKLAMMALDLQPGDEVITSAFSFYATAETIVEMGAIPVYVDIDPITYNIDPALIEAAITSKTKGIVTVDLYGLPASYDEINRIAKKHGLWVVEDAAQAFGATYHDRPACSLADIACTSFYPVKPLGCYGDGGACFTNNDALATKIRRLGNHGQVSRYEHHDIGTTGRLDTLQAAFLLEKFALFPGEVVARQQAAQWYQQALECSVAPPVVASGYQSVWAQYTIRVPQRDHFQRHMQAKGVPTTVHYPRAFTQIEVLKAYFSDNQRACPVAEKAASEVVSLPFHPYISRDDVNTVAQYVNEYMATIAASAEAMSAGQ